MEWGVKEAQGQFEELVETALTKGPQIVRTEGDRSLVLLSAEDYADLRSGPQNLVDHLLVGPSWDDELVDIIGWREKTPYRDIQV